MTQFCDITCNVLRDLVAFVQFKKRKKHPWRIITFSKVAGIKGLVFDLTLIRERARYL